ncbi:hypothetical protein RFI_39960 [Reticulomyxa filosa]|uniref:Uncharacterized protein n=1 Tax=Reticulomyxa filosa TaxID=46433 RepID=X6L7Z1_RETFI|nr:hypothetical protein RFI_39960 [Reticulomyxa filosa]|eukprot:ETN97570.1 hypothetical protein RFI_39960 [Reticulomyxa filosa]
MALELVPLVDSERQKAFEKVHNVGFYQFSPQSHIVHTDFTIEMKMLLLYEKYVSTRAHFELNLPSATKDEWKNYCETVRFDFGIDNFEDVVKSLFVRAYYVYHLYMFCYVRKHFCGYPSVFVNAQKNYKGNEELVEVIVDSQGFIRNEDSDEDVEKDDVVEDDGNKNFGGALMPAQASSFLANEKQLNSNKPKKIKSSQLATFYKTDEMRIKYYKQVLDLCDKVVKECYGLMMDSYSRFDAAQMREHLRK